MEERIENALREQLTNQMVRALSKYAHYLVRRHYWMGQQGGEILPGGETADSLVARTVLKLLEGKNRWDPDQVDLFTFLRMNVRREVGHLAKSQENRTLSRMDEEILLNFSISTQDQAEQWIEEFLLFLHSQHDRLLEGIVDCILDGKLRPEYIAKDLGVEVSEIYNARKRLSRLMKKFLDKRGCREDYKDER